MSYIYSIHYLPLTSYAVPLRFTDNKNYGFFIERTIKKIRQHFQREMNEANTGITVDQWVILDLVNRKEALSQNEIAELSYKDAPTVTRIIDLLCKKGLLFRTPDASDRRRLKIRLTPTGEQKVEAVYPVVADLRKRGWKGLTDEDFAHLLRILDTIFHNFD